MGGLIMKRIDEIMREEIRRADEFRYTDDWQRGFVDGALYADEHPKKDLPKEYEKNAKWNRVNFIFYKVTFYLFVFLLGESVGTAMWTYSKEGFAMAIIGTIVSGLFTLYFNKKGKRYDKNNSK